MKKWVDFFAQNIVQSIIDHPNMLSNYIIILLLRVARRPCCMLLVESFLQSSETTLFKSFLEEKKNHIWIAKKCIYVVINAVGKPSKAMYIMYRKVGGLLRHSPHSPHMPHSTYIFEELSYTSPYIPGCCPTRTTYIILYTSNGRILLQVRFVSARARICVL